MARIAGFGCLRLQCRSCRGNGSASATRTSFAPARRSRNPPREMVHRDRHPPTCAARVTVFRCLDRQYTPFDLLGNVPLASVNRETGTAHAPDGESIFLKGADEQQSPALQEVH